MKELLQIKLKAVCLILFIIIILFWSNFTKITVKCCMCASRIEEENNAVLLYIHIQRKQTANDAVL